MKRIHWLMLIFIALLLPASLHSEEAKSWEFSAEGNLYIIPDQTYFNPVISADRNHLHLEGRYNDEALHTGSIWAGYNFHTGSTLEFNITPMIGGVFGDIDGIAPGYSFELIYGKISLSSEGEYFFSSEEKESNFFYSWSEISYSPKDWFWFGIVGQRTRAYKTDLDIQRGLFLGFGYRNLTVTGYWMNPDDQPFGLISMGYSF